jgi:amino acid transporter
MTMWKQASRGWILGLAIALGGGAGCAAAAAAGAGAGGAYYFTSRGVGSQVNGDVDQVANKAQTVLAAEGVQVTDTKTEDSGARRVLEGKEGDLDVSVEVKRHDDGSSKVEVSARKNTVEWDKDYAQKLLDRIVAG